MTEKFHSASTDISNPHPELSHYKQAGCNYYNINPFFFLKKKKKKGRKRKKYLLYIAIGYQFMLLNPEALDLKGGV